MSKLFSGELSNVRCQSFTPAPEAPTDWLSFFRNVHICGFLLNVKVHGQGGNIYFAIPSKFNVTWTLWKQPGIKVVITSCWQWSQLTPMNQNHTDTFVFMSGEDALAGPFKHSFGYNLQSAHSRDTLLKPDSAAIFGTILYLPISHANNK